MSALYTHDSSVWIPDHLKQQDRWLPINYEIANGKVSKRPTKAPTKQNLKPYHPNRTGFRLIDSKNIRDDDTICIDRDKRPADGFVPVANEIFDHLRKVAYWSPSLSGILLKLDYKEQFFIRGRMGKKKLNMLKTIGCEVFCCNQTINVVGKGSKVEPPLEQTFINKLRRLADKIDDKALTVEINTKPPENDRKRPMDDLERSDLISDKRIVAEIIDAFRKANVPLCATNDEFVERCYELKSAGLTTDEIVEIMEADHKAHYPEMNIDDAHRRIESMNPESQQINKLIKYSKLVGVLPNNYPYQNRGVKDDKDDTPVDSIPIPSNLSPGQAFEMALSKLGIKIRENELIGNEVLLPGQKDWQEIDHVMLCRLQLEYVGRFCTQRVGKQDKSLEVSDRVRREVIDALAARQPSVNKTRDWLLSIDRKYIKQDWEAIDVYLSCYQLDCYDRLKESGRTEQNITDYYRNGVVVMFYGWIMRSLKPGCLYDKFVVLVGRTGCGKGLGLQSMLQPESVDPKTGVVTPNSAYRDQCRLSTKRDDWYLNRQCSVGEVTELQGFNKIDAENMKAIISATHDYIEHKYRTGRTCYPKAYALIGTTNNPGFKPSDPEDDRRTYILDVGYGFEGGKKHVAEKITERLTDEWRLRTVGHVLWMIENGYTANINDWSDEVEDCRLILAGMSAKKYPQIEAALTAVATGNVDLELPGWKIYQYKTKLKPDKIQQKGLAFNPDNYPQHQATWLRLLSIHNPWLVSRYGVEKIKAVAEQMGWVMTDRGSGHGYKRTRSWLIPTGFAPTTIDDQTYVPPIKDKSGKDLSWMEDHPMTTEAEDLAKERKSRRDLDDLYRRQKRDADKIDRKDDESDNPDDTNDQ